MASSSVEWFKDGSLTSIEHIRFRIVSGIFELHLAGSLVDALVKN